MANEAKRKPPKCSAVKVAEGARHICGRRRGHTVKHKCLYADGANDKGPCNFTWNRGR
jgi:hypothetical protein